MTTLSEWVPPATHGLDLPDGRRLTYCLYGPDDGVPVVSSNPTPHIRWERPDVIEAYHRVGVRVLSYDRPGYGGSSRQPGRTVADAASDVAALADAQGWDRFAVTGFSGGGAPALACGVLLRGRVTRCAVVAGTAPYDAPGLDFFAGMSPDNADGFRLATRGAGDFRARTDRVAAEVLAELAAAAPDGGRLARMRAMLLDGRDGWTDDMVSLVRPWGFAVRDIAVPVGVWYSPDDRNSPPGHGEWLLAAVERAEGHRYAGGHEPGPDTADQVLRWLMA
ncbi:alpha/beta fold hydrolase [Actinocatenispora sera]|uniref:Alpha/beta hydrolase n=1 Tax=Actinocatenispora sera TaxID=390989 RepID=A0A810L385_9ACTN|nr:alpha/beta hydrolase [Actinocatenispora sera]BCJ29687.1 alpha/beta hydrolase [Actinocatenispora sera]